MKRKFTALILAALCAATSSVCLSACNFGNTPTTPVPPTSSGSEDEEQQPAPPALTFDGFIKNHKSAAVKFFEDFIYADVVGNRSVKAENCYLNDKDGDNKVESAAMCYIYCLNETERAVEVANITFAPVNVQDVVDGKVTALNATVSRNTVFTFDAKEEENQAQASALLSETQLGGVLLKSTAYTLETFEEEQPPVNPNPPEEPDDPVTVTNAEIIAALNENCIDGIVNATRVGGLKQDKQFIVDGTWYLTKDNNGNITKAEFAYNYQKNSTDAYYVITEVEFSSPLTAQNIKDGNIEISNCTNKYNNTASYNPTIQDSYAELTQVICNKAFGESNTANRYLIMGSVTLDDNGKNMQGFTVIQIENDNVKEASIGIETATTSDKYLENFNNGKHTTTTYGKSYEILGEKLIAE